MVSTPLKTPIKLNATSSLPFNLVFICKLTYFFGLVFFALNISLNLKSIRINSIPFSFEILIPLNFDIDTFYADFVYLFKIEIYTNEFFTFTHRLKL